MHYFPEDFELKKQEACIKLAEFIIDAYNTSLKSQVVTEIIRRSQFRYLLTILECYEIFQLYCNLSHERDKGVTIKTQAIKLLVKYSKPASDQAPRLHAKLISKLLKGALRIRRLLKLAENNFNIIDAFPDLDVNFFTGTRLNAPNFEIWLMLVERNTIISAKQGKILYKKYKAAAKKERSENLRKKMVDS